MPTKLERQQATTQMNHCSCGNIARLGVSLCGVCENQNEIQKELALCNTVEDLKMFIAAHLMEQG